MNSILAAVLGMAVDAFVRPVLGMVRIRAALRDRETLQTVRRGILAVCGVTACVVFLCGGAILLPLALCLFMPWEPNTRLWVALAFAAVYVAIPMTVAAIALSEKRWMHYFHVDELINESPSER
jgi:uncharacterized membrane protein YeiB